MHYCRFGLRAFIGLSVGTYYLLACAISWPIFWWRDQRPASWAMWQAPGYVKGLLPAFGPATAAIVCLFLFRRTHCRFVTFTGTSSWRSAVFITVPAALLAVYGVGDDEPHLTGLLFGGVLSLYALGEEFGWRGFLQDGLRPLAPPTRFAIIGVLWGVWHFTTFVHGSLTAVCVRLGLLLALWVGGSWALGLLADRTASVLATAAMHLVFNYFVLLPTRTCLAVLAPSLAVWMFLIRDWPPTAVFKMIEEAVGTRNV